MAGYTVAPMTAEDLAALGPHLDNNLTREHIAYRLDSLPGFNMSLRRTEGELLMCAGVQFFWPGVGEAWLWTLPGFRPHAVAGIRRVEQWLTASMVFYDLWRVECLVRTDRPSMRRLLARLGFEHEGTKRQFGPNREDFDLFARLDREAKEASP